MQYPFPELGTRCPLCDGAGCAVYRGYYRRLLCCPEMEHFGRIVIRTAFCRTRRVRFALLPDFVIPRRRISRLGVARLTEARLAPGCARMREAIDDWMEGLSDEFYLPLSTAHAYLNPRTAAPP